jgi:hypothetical protein
MKNGGINFFMLVVLLTVFIASLRHIAEAWKRRDFDALGEGAGTMVFSGIGIILKAFF